MTLILKDGQDPTFPSLYHPIALLNQDAKLFPTIMVNHLKLILTRYIDKDQTGFIPTRNIESNIHKALNIIP